MNVLEYSIESAGINNIKRLFMNLCDYDTVCRILKKHGFTFSKSLGQNFIVNPEICPAMAKSLNAGAKTGVLEIGAGVGVLTKELCAVAGKVVCIELDKRLFPVLDETLGEFGNLELVEGDAMKLDLNGLINEKFNGMEKIKICANLPYYITSPIIMKLLESRLCVDEIVVMVQKEAADRLTAQVGSKNSGALTVAVNYYAQAERLFDVERSSFMPAPKVDSAVIRLKMREKPPVEVKDEKRFFVIVKAVFAQRRKTAVNCLSNCLGIPKEQIANALNEIGRSEKDRAESFSMQELARLSELI